MIDRSDITDPTTINILNAIRVESKSLTDIANELNISRSEVSK